MSVIRSFTSLQGPATRAPSITTRLPKSHSPIQSRFSSQYIQTIEESDTKYNGKETLTEEEELEALLEEELDTEYGTNSSKEVSSTPWYLQVDTPERKPQPLSERQQIPELPATPPPILEPLLKQISIDLGIDSLTLLDLRKLDPPPALGANLIMLLGTARSERHLHVSADRLCRWLRSNYKLRPDADGLLGRNELKLKLKRKANRAKLLGRAADEDGDDGVRTGWVCVDLGAVEADPAAVEEPQRKDFVGFGRRVDGVRIVVQLLTEEKREEIELEKLWEGILRRGVKEKQDIEDALKEQDQAQFST